VARRCALFQLKVRSRVAPHWHWISLKGSQPNSPPGWLGSAAALSDLPKRAAAGPLIKWFRTASSVNHHPMFQNCRRRIEVNFILMQASRGPQAAIASCR
jgi:hypothetical protein